MYKKRKRKKIIIALVICFVVSIIVNIILTDRELTIFEKAIKDSILTVQKVILMPVDAISNSIEKNKAEKIMYEEYTNLKEEIKKYENLVIENKELEDELYKLQDMLVINELFSSYEPVNATMIARNLSYWDETITVDKGENDGIKKGMAVIVADGLVGKVISTSIFNSTVRLLTANVDNVSVKIETTDGFAYGILNKYDNNFIVEGIQSKTNIEIGSRVTTTGMGDIFPSGIVIGTVINKKMDNFGLTEVLEVESDLDFDDIKYVTILKRGNE